MNNRSKIQRLIERMMSGVSLVELDAMSKTMDLNEVGLHGRTPLMVAAAEGMLAAIETLVHNGASVHCTGLRQMTALHEASTNGWTVIVDYLLSAGAEVDAETVDGVTPLMCAAAWGNSEVVNRLLESNADPTKVDRMGATAMDIALEKGEEKTASLISLSTRI